MIYGVSLAQLIIGIICFIWTIITIIALFFFGKLIKHQFKIWALARRGYVQIRHVREDMNEDYYFIRFKDGHYTFSGGVYMEQKDTKTNTLTILAKFDYELLSKKADHELDALEKQLKTFFDNIKDNKIMDIKTLPWGIPTITYYGTDPQPINFKERKKIYDAKNIAAMIKRILMTKEWKLVRMVLILCVIAIFAWMVLGFLSYGLISKNANSLAICQQSLNTTLNQYMTLVNQSIAPVQNTTITI